MYICTLTIFIKNFWMALYNRNWKPKIQNIFIKNYVQQTAYLGRQFKTNTGKKTDSKEAIECINLE